MAIFASDDDADNYFVRVLFNRELGREPGVGEQAPWVAHKRTVGADLCLAHLRDAPEATNFRKARGW
ncbi:MAG: hypothetical protein NVSMB4_00460 [Acidimicrobiales bacterium]